MSIVTKPYTFPLTGPVIRSAEINADYDVLYNDYNGNITNANVAPAAAITYDKLVTMSGDATITGAGVITVTGSGSGLLPAGSIQQFYDFGGLVTFNTALWRYCDGSVLAYPGSPLNGQTLPDLSGRYFVGFGTDGGGNIGTAPWATLPVGNAGNTVNLQHSHTVNSHTHAHTHTITAHDHTMGNHTHSAGAHTHGVGTLQFEVGEYVQGTTATGANFFNHANSAVLSANPETSLSLYDSGGTLNIIQGSVTYGEPLTANHAMTDFTATTANGTGSTAAGSGNTDVPSTNTTSSVGLTTDSGGTAEAPGTNNQLSTTQNIQPSSIRVRYIIKVM